jgi:hypothetical protein
LHLFTNEEAAAWCRDRGFQVEGRPRISSVQLSKRTGHTLRLKIPTQGRQTISMAYVVLMSELEEDVEEYFAGGLLWFRDWNIGSETYERVGLSLLQGLRGAGRADDLGTKPALVLGPSEFAVANAAVTLPLLFQWDAWYFPQSGGWMATISHDGYAEVEAETRDLMARLSERFARGGWLVQ